MRITVGPVLPRTEVTPSSGDFTSKQHIEMQGISTNGKHFDIPVNVPANAKILATSLRVDVALSSSDGGNSFTAQYTGGSSLLICKEGGFVKNTKIDMFHDAIGSATSNVTNIRVTCNAGKTFKSGGKVTVVVYYQTIKSLASV